MFYRRLPVLPGAVALGICALGVGALVLGTSPRAFAAPVERLTSHGAASGNVRIGASFTVSVASDIDDGNYSPGNLSLREGVKLANQAGGDGSSVRIAISPALNGQPLVLLSPLPNITADVLIAGQGPTLTHVQRGGGATPAFRIFTCTGDVQISGLKVSGGVASASQLGGAKGGAIYNQNSMELRNCEFSDNTAATGGAIFSSHSCEIYSCYFGNNTATDPEIAGGGHIDSTGPIWLANSFLTGGFTTGDASGEGAACRVLGRVSFTISNSTITGNGKYTLHIGTGTLRTVNSIIAGNAGQDIIATDDETYENQGYNIIGNNDSVQDIFPAGSFTGTAQVPLDPKVEYVTGSDGRKAIALKANSPAINTGNPDGPDFFESFDDGLDGRGAPRIYGGRLDIGAYEAQFAPTIDLTVALAPEAPDTISEDAGLAATTLRVSRGGHTSGNLTVTLTTPTPTRIKVPASVIIPDGEAFVDVPVNAVNNTKQDGPADYIVRAAAAGTTYIFDPAGVIHVIDDEAAVAALSGSFDPETIDEAGTTEVTLNITRQLADNSAAVDVVLTSTDTRFGLPLTVTIPAGSSTVRAVIPFTPNPATVGPVQSTVLMSAPGYNGGTAKINIEDADASFSLEVTPGAPTAFSEGAGAVGTKLRISVPSAATQNTSFNLAVLAGIGQVTIPGTVTIQAGKTYVDVTVAAVDDNKQDGTQRVVIEARGGGFANARTMTLAVYDNDTAYGLSGSVSPSTFTEATRSITLTISHARPDLSKSVKVLLSSADSRFKLPGAVVIPAGSRSVSVDAPFKASPANEGTTRSVIVLSSPGFTDGEAAVTVTDPLAKLTLALSPGSTDRFTDDAGAHTSIRVSRNSLSTGELVVNLSTRAGSGPASFADQVTIPAGADYIDTEVASNGDITGSPKRIIIDARSNGFAPSSITLYVTDSGLPPIGGCTFECGIGAPVSTVALSTVSASAAAGTVTLTFTGAVGGSAADAAKYSVTVGGNATAILGAITKAANTVELKVEGLNARDAVTVTYDIVDASGKALQGSAKTTVK